MPLFELDAGRLVPAQFGHPVTEPLEPEILDAVRDQVLDIVQRPLFPVRWHGAEREGPRRLTAMDAGGNAVTVEVLDRLDAVSLVSALGHAGRAGELGWIELAEMYPRGVAAFRRDWNAFREARPAGSAPGPGLVVVAGAVEPEVRQAVATLGAATVLVHEVALRQMSNGRRFLETRELTRPAVSAPDRVLTGRVRPHQELTEGEVPAPDHSERAAAADRDQGVRGVAEAAHAPRVHGTEGDTPPMGVARPALADLATALAGETPLVWHQLRRGEQHEATLTPQGTVRLPDGTELADPSEAARAVSGREEVDGWQVWRFGPDGPTLAESWDELRRTPARPPGTGRHGRRQG